MSSTVPLSEHNNINNLHMTNKKPGGCFSIDSLISNNKSSTQDSNSNSPTSHKTQAQLVGNNSTSSNTNESLSCSPPLSSSSSSSSSSASSISVKKLNQITATTTATSSPQTNQMFQDMLMQNSMNMWSHHHHQTPPGSLPLGHQQGAMPAVPPLPTPTQQSSLESALQFHIQREQTLTMFRNGARFFDPRFNMPRKFIFKE
jgi:hypothetical protein